jgi:hypothetical protein
MAKRSSPDKLNLSDKIQGYRWKLPKLPGNAHLARDELKCRLDFYQDTVILYWVEEDVITTRVVSARDIVMAMLREVPLRSGVLPEGALFWRQSVNGVEVGLWRPPQVWPAALQVEVFKPPRRFKLPMPGLIFVCSSGRAPRVYAAKRRPTQLNTPVYHAPLFNLFQSGMSCAGTHKFPQVVEEVPESFFTSFFTMTADHKGRSKKHGDNLLNLWEELDGKRRYPLSDLVKFGTMEDIMK